MQEWLISYTLSVDEEDKNFVAIIKGYKAKNYFDGHNLDEEKGAIKL